MVERRGPTAGSEVVGASLQSGALERCQAHSPAELPKRTVVTVLLV